MTPLGWIGVWLLVAGGAAIVVEGVLAGVWGMAVAKRSRALQERIETERGLIEADLQRLQDALEETRRLWRPYRRALRWLRHPIAIALMQSFAGRRAGR
ncbi:MAG TPA: hypothetical protein VGR34_05735 [Candidatus Dormibacteraeota bacterium]|nr:hypothetical protein [Candidatus Dormibacteraeota bacterium]